VLVAMTLFWALPLASAYAGQGCVKKGTCGGPVDETGDPHPDKGNPHPDKGNPSPGTPPEDSPGNPNPGDKNPSGGTEPPPSGGGSSGSGGGGGSTDEPSSASDGDGRSGGGTTQTTGGDATGGAATGPWNARNAERKRPTVSREPSTRGPRRVTFQPTDANTGPRFFRGRDVLDVVANASQVAAFPLFLALIVAVFLLVQYRIDRKDPKLAGAARTRDYLTFD
jgi:hypothetical protein